jgi:putative acetyltransferase
MTDSVMIRGLRGEDSEALFELWDMPAVVETTFDTPYMAEDTFRDRLAALPGKAHVLVAETAMPSGRTRLAGIAWLEPGARRKRYVADLSFVMHPDFRASPAENELMRAVLDLADNWLDVGRTQARVFADDPYTTGLLAEHGFEQEATLKRYAQRGGTYADAHLLARLRADLPVEEPDSSPPAPKGDKPKRKSGTRLDITIRGKQADDWEDFAAIRDQDDVIFHTLQVPYYSHDLVRERYENVTEDVYGLVAVVDEQVVGALGLHLGSGRRAHVGALGMMVHTDYQGRGVGSALMTAAVDLAENWLDLSRLELEVFTDNSAGIGLYEKYGFVIEGTLRAYALRDGQYADTYQMARLRGEAQ